MTLTLALLSGGREHVLNALADNVAWQRTRIKSPEGAASLLVEIAKQTVLNEASAMILPQIQHWYNALCESTAGSMTEDDQWVEAHDDGVLALLEPYADTLSASWLAFTSTDIQLWKDGEDEKLAKSFAHEVWKQLSWKRTDRQILAGVGIVHDDLAQFGHMPELPPEPIQPEFSQMRVNSILNRIMLTMPDPATLSDDLDFVSDDDDGLAMGAAQRLGIDMDDVLVLRQARNASGSAIDAWHNAIEGGELLDEAKTYVDLDPVVDPEPAVLNDDLEVAPIKRTALPPLPPSHKLPPPPPPPPLAGNGTARPVPPPPPPPPTSGTTTEAPAKRGRPAKSHGDAPAGAIRPEILRSIKEHSGIRDEDMADMMGISRPTLASIMKGKAWYVPPDESRREAIKNMLVMHINALTVAHGLIDNT